MGPLGMGEVVVLVILALLIFGPKKLPELGKTFGKGMAEFKRASNELKSTFQREMDNIEHETRDVKSLARDVTSDINTSYYDDNDDDYYSDYDYGAGSTTSTSSASSSSADASAAAAKAGSEPVPEPLAGDGEEVSPDTAASAGQSDAEPVSGVPEAEAVATTNST
ncbi:MAG: twin-arginine translocase TatA/TatE family subunit [Bryobacterales bacterium]|nr:twin-arginine translocase TatA/TatE family subunit [Bryobacterales bacterium]